MSHLFTVNNWLHQFQQHRRSNVVDDPNYYIKDPKELSASCTPISFELGIGEQLLSRALEKCTYAKHEVLIVTCFWAKSKSQESIASLLQKLSAKACMADTVIRVRICFSSYSLPQKLFHTASIEGQEYPPSSWANKFGLPPPEELQGLDLSIKSVFVRPFSVIHPKFIIVDRQKAFLPSFNVSWEKWFEGCLEFEGELVGKLVKFWQCFWDRRELLPLPDWSEDPVTRHFTQSLQNSTTNSSAPLSPADSIFQTSFESTEVSALLLPSPHHVNPHFQPCLSSAARPPPTPLNSFLLHIFSTAKRTIFIQTPNITSSPAIECLCAALRIGIDVKLITSSKLMLLEQLVTAGTITELALRSLQRKYEMMVAEFERSDNEQQLLRPGDLSISYYKPRSHGGVNEPVKSHLKIVIVDDEIVLLGSGNMDRASWFTSQELGIAFFSKDMAATIQEGLKSMLEGRISHWS